MTRPVRTPVDPAYLRDLFSHSARLYDRVNQITSWGQVGRWRDETVELAAPGPVDRVLDAFCGSGGLAARVVGRLGTGGELVLADLSPVMLHEARRRIAPQSDRPHKPGPPRPSAPPRRSSPSRLSGQERMPTPRMTYVAGDILRDDLGLDGFDVVLLGWGLRYVPDVPAAIARLSGFLRPGGRLVILEFTRPTALIWALPAQFYFRRVLPRVGSWLARDRELYEYLRASSETFLDTRALIETVDATGVTVTEWRTHFGGLVTILLATRGGGAENPPPHMSL